MTDDQALIDEAVEMCDASEKSGRVTVAGLGIREVRSLAAALERALMDSKRLDWLSLHPHSISFSVSQLDYYFSHEPSRRFPTLRAALEAAITVAIDKRPESV